MVYSALCLIVFSFVFVSSKENLPCLRHLAEDITDGKRLSNGAILKNNVTYDRHNYFTENGKKWGCTCNLNMCIQMCCGVNEVYVNKTCTMQNKRSELNISVFEGTNKLRDISIRNFSLISSKECPKKHVRTEGSDVNYIQKNGSLFIVEGEDQYVFNIGYYCLAKNKDNSLESIVCDFHDEEAEKEAEATRDMYAKGNNLHLFNNKFT